MSTLEEHDIIRAYGEAQATKPMRAFKTREQELEETLRELLTKHFYSTRLEWSHQEGSGLLDLDVKLYAKIVSLVPGILEEME